MAALREHLERLRDVAMFRRQPLPEIQDEAARASTHRQAEAAGEPRDEG